MYAIVYKADGYPVCRQVPGVSPDPVVTWNTEGAAARQAHEREMPLVQIAHGRHERHVGGERAAQRRDVAQDLHHPRLKNSRRLRIARSRDTSSSKSESRSTKFKFSEFTMRSGAAS